MAQKQSKLNERKKMLEYSVMCALFIKEIRKLDDKALNNWFMVMNKTNGFEDSFVLLFRDMVKKCLFDEYDRRQAKKEQKKICEK